VAAHFMLRAVIKLVFVVEVNSLRKEINKVMFVILYLKQNLYAPIKRKWIQSRCSYLSRIWSSWWPVDTQLVAYRQATRTLIESDGTICCLYTTIPSWRWALDARNM